MAITQDGLGELDSAVFALAPTIRYSLIRARAIKSCCSQRASDRCFSRLGRMHYKYANMVRTGKRSINRMRFGGVHIADAKVQSISTFVSPVNTCRETRLDSLPQCSLGRVPGSQSCSSRNVTDTRPALPACARSIGKTELNALTRKDQAWLSTTI